ncbi:MAG TPA: adenylate/guanylate cyclase domain-containing protein [Reyranellaceae bacterium]|nr:adenylate/guanylate cyclase domain-containing protein [Reyranellaceae bacterium]
MTVTAPGAAANGGRWLRLPLIVALGLAFASLAVTSGVAYVAVLAGATGTTERLLVDRTNRLVEAQVALLNGRLHPVTEHLEFIASLAASGRLKVDSPTDMREALAVMMGQVRGISATAFASLDFQLHRVIRHPDGQLQRDSVPMTEHPQNLARYRELQIMHRTYWGALFWSEAARQPVLNVRTPIRRVDDAFLGGLAATVAVGDLSYLLGDPGRGSDGRYFILTGKKHDQVLAHRRLVDPRGLNLSEEKPLPSIHEVDDPILAKFHDPPVGNPRVERALGGLGHLADAGGTRWVFVYRQVRGYGPEPWLVGRYFPLEDQTSDLERLTNGAMVGAATLAIALLIALVMGLRMARSIATITDAARQIEQLEFDKPFHQPSRLREIDEAGRSLDKARQALRWFEAYVPRRLVFRLMAAGENGVVSRRRDVTVMFTDIVEFTPQAEDLPESETAELLNHHFALLGAAIEHEHGMIDKYIGDSVMAVWGGISKMEDHADAAVRATLACARAIVEDNEVRRASGKQPIRMRVGLHSGTAVVGNIGAPGRVNFTLVGDTVNVAQRFEQLGKEFMTPSDEVVILASGDTIRALTEPPEALGLKLGKPELRQLRGHDEPVEVYRLL